MPSLLSFAVLIIAFADAVCDARNDAMKCKSPSPKNTLATTTHNHFEKQVVFYTTVLRFQNHSK